jgi:outer membrane autotransporter protein
MVAPPAGGQQAQHIAALQRRTISRLPCDDIRRHQTGVFDGCPDPRVRRTAFDDRYPGIPLTAGRDVGVETLWNAWSEGTFVSLSDKRFELDTKNRTWTTTVGLDRKLGENVVGGLQFGVQSGRGSGFSGFTQSQTEGLTVGPYLAVRLSPNWAIDGSLSFAESRRDRQIITLTGTAVSRAWTGNATLHWQTTVGEWFLRTKASVSYTRSVAGANDLNGTLLGFPISLHFPEARSSFAVADGYAEISRLFSISEDIHVIPYLELGLHYQFLRPNGGAMLAGDLSTVIPSAWAGSLRSGARMQLPGNALLDLSAAYLSLGVSDLNVWEGKVRLSLGF